MQGELGESGAVKGAWQEYHIGNTMLCSIMNGLFHLIRVPPLLMTDLFAYPGTKFCLDTPRTGNSLRRIAENLLKLTREYRDILACQYPLGQALKNHP